jgi:DNA-binding transcriptional LysR family regulator
VNVDLRHLRYFVAVGEELHFGRAAARVRIAQSPLSQAILDLERQLGTQLLTRTTRRVALTHAGHRLLDDAQTLLADLDAAVDAARRADRAEATLRIGVLSSTAMFAAPIARRLADHQAGVQLELDTIGIGEIGPALRAERIDVVIGYVPNSLPDWPGLGADIRMDTLRELRVVAALPADHPLAARAEINLAELRDERWVHIPPDVSPDFHDNLLSLCDRHGFRPRVVATGNTIQALLELVAGGVGVMAVGDNATSLRPVGVAYVPVAGESAILALFSRHGDDSQAVGAFRAAAAEALTGPRPA